MMKVTSDESTTAMRSAGVKALKEMSFVAGASEDDIVAAVWAAMHNATVGLCPSCGSVNTEEQLVTQSIPTIFGEVTAENVPVVACNTCHHEFVGEAGYKVREAAVRNRYPHILPPL